MKQAVYLHDFTDAFRDIRPNNFTYAGLAAMYEYLEQLEDDTGEEFELDVISICCDFSEYHSAQEAYNEYNSEAADGDDEDEREAFALDWFQDRTSTISFDGGIILGCF